MRNNSWPPYVEPSAGGSERHVCASAHLDEQLPVSGVRVVPDSSWFEDVVCNQGH